MTLEQQRAIALASARRRRAEAEAAAALTGNAEEPEAEDSAVPQTKEEWAAYSEKAIQRDYGKKLVGLADAALSSTSGAVGSIFGGLAGAGDMVLRGDMEKANDTYNRVSEAIQFSPFTEEGNKVLGAVGDVVEPVIDRGREELLRVSGNNPAVATFLETTLLGVPELATGGRLGLDIYKRPKLRKPVIGDAEAAARLGVEPGTTQIPFTPKAQSLQEMEAAATRLGIDLNNSTIKDSTIRSAEVLSSGVARAPGDLSAAGGRAATGAEDLHTAAATAEQASRAQVNAAYTAARSLDASVDLTPIKRMTEETELELRNAGADLGENTVLATRLKELEDIDERVIGARHGADKRKIPGQSSVILGPDGTPIVAKTGAPVPIPLNELEIMNARLTTDIQNARGAGRHGDARHLRVLRTRINDMLDKQFELDMISGDKTAKDAWRTARLANRRHKERFSDDRVIRSIVQNQHTAKDTVKIIFGASEIGHRAEAALTVRRLKDILGPDAPELQALRNAFFADLFDPIFKDSPSWGMALERIRRVKRDDGVLIRELGVSAGDIDFMERAIRVAKGVTTKADLDKKGFAAMIISRLAFGHEIAKAGVITRTSNMILNRALGVGQKTHAQLLREFSGEAPPTPLLKLNDPRVRNLNIHAAIQSEIENADEEPEER